MPRTYVSRGFSQPTQVYTPDPVGSLAGMMQLGLQMDRRDEQEREQKEAEQLRTAINSSRGDLDAAAKSLESQGNYVRSRELRENAKAIREQALADITGKVEEQKTVYGRAREVARQAQTHPEMWGDLRPHLMDAAMALDPRLAQELPEQYDPTAVKGIADLVEGGAVQAEVRGRGMKQMSELLKLQADARERFDGEQKWMDEQLAVAGSQEEWDSVHQIGRLMGLSGAAMSRGGEKWSKEAQDAANKRLLTPNQRVDAAKVTNLPSTFQAAIVAANAKGDTKGVEALMELAGEYDRQTDRGAAGGGGATAKVTPDMVAAVVKHPGLWNDLTPTVKSAMMADLSAQGFDFQAAANSLTQGQRGTIERWRADRLREIAANDDNLSDAEIEEAQKAVEASYRIQIGTAAPAPGSGRPRRSAADVLPPGQRPASGTAPAAPPARGAAPPRSSAGAPPSGGIVVNIPGYGRQRFKDRAALDAFLADAGMEVSEPK